MADSTISWETAKQWLVALTSDLKESSTTRDTLLAARKDVAIAVTAGQIHNEDTFEYRSIYSPSNIALMRSRRLAVRTSSSSSFIVSSVMRFFEKSR